MNKIEFKRDREKTLLQNVADLKALGDWYCCNYFLAYIKAIVNDKPVGNFEGTVMGDNIGYCIVCGTPINNHYTIKDRKTKTMYNVGSKCIHRIIDEKKAVSIKKGVSSLMNKIRSDFLRPFKHNAVSKWLESHAKGSDKIRNPKHLDWLQTIWLKQVSVGDIALEEELEGIDFNMHGRPLVTYSYDSLNKMWDENDIYHRGSKDYWSFHARMFSDKNWNPDNMRNHYNDEAKRYGTEKIPTWTKLFSLSEKQDAELNKLITNKINEYLNELEIKGGG